MRTKAEKILIPIVVVVLLAVIAFLVYHFVVKDNKTDMIVLRSYDGKSQFELVKDRNIVSVEESGEDSGIPALLITFKNEKDFYDTNVADNEYLFNTVGLSDGKIMYFFAKDGYIYYMEYDKTEKTAYLNNAASDFDYYTLPIMSGRMHLSSFYQDEETLETFYVYDISYDELNEYLGAKYAQPLFGDYAAFKSFYGKLNDKFVFFDDDAQTVSFNVYQQKGWAPGDRQTTNFPVKLIFKEDCITIDIDGATIWDAE